MVSDALKPDDSESSERDAQLQKKLNLSRVRAVDKIKDWN
jgi:hypothetical protein